MRDWIRWPPGSCSAATFRVFRFVPPGLLPSPRLGLGMEPELHATAAQCLPGAALSPSYQSRLASEQNGTAEVSHRALSKHRATSLHCCSRHQSLLHTWGSSPAHVGPGLGPHLGRQALFPIHMAGSRGRGLGGQRGLPKPVKSYPTTCSVLAMPRKHSVAMKSEGCGTHKAVFQPWASRAG